MTHTSRPISFIHPATKESLTIPEVVANSAGEILTHYQEKNEGWSPGGWYQDRDGKTFMVKFAYNSSLAALPYIEKMFNDMARACVGDIVPTVTEIGRGFFNARYLPCYIASRVDGYKDISSIATEDEEEEKSVELRKSYAKEHFHRFYSFCALIANDDLNEENFGLTYDADGSCHPLIIDLGSDPAFLNPLQIDYAAIPFYLASLIGHRNLNLMPITRNRYFGHEDFINPLDRLKPQKDQLKEEDISYLAVLDGINLIASKRDEILSIAASSFENVMSDETLSFDEKEQYAKKYRHFPAILTSRIDWMAETFRDDLPELNDEEERKRFAAVKWRLHPEFNKLMAYQDLAFKECASKELAKEFTVIADLLDGQTSEEILDLDLRSVETPGLKEFVSSKFILHNAIVAGDYDLIEWLAKNDLCDINQNLKTRTHNYQLFRTTPLHAAISTYHDKLFYQKHDELAPLKKVIDILAEKFFEKNGLVRNSDHEFPVASTFGAYNKFQRLASPETLSATKVQRAFRAYKADRLAPSIDREIES